MICYLYKCTDDRKVINKTLTNGVEKNIVLLDKQNVLKPIIKLKNFPEDYNYCYIPTLQRYYYIENVYIEHNSLFVMSLTVDVLKTYETEIQNSTGDIIESENVLNADRLDYESELTDTVNEVALTNPFTDTSDIMITVQG